MTAANNSCELTHLTPAVDWRDGSPLGNGVIGAMVYGRVADERVLLNHEELWYDGVVPDLPDVSTQLAGLRELMQQDAFAAANATYPDALAAGGGCGKTAKYHPAGDLRLKTKNDRLFRSYRRRLDLHTGLSTVTWSDGECDYRRESFVSRPDNLFVLRLRASVAGSVSVDIGLEPHDLRDAIDQKARPFDVPIDFTPYADADTDVLGLSATYHRPGGRSVGLHAGYDIAARVIATGGTSEVRSSEIVVTGADEVLILVQLGVRDDAPDAASPDTAPQAAGAAARALRDEPRGFDALFAPHAQAHAQVFDRTTFELGDHPGDTPCERLLLNAYEHGEACLELTQKMAAFGRYLLIGSAGRTPSHLQGVWNGDYAPPWDCFYMANENLQMNYWQALPGALPELARGMFDFYRDRVEDFRTNARRLYGCRGILIPALITPQTGLPTNPSPHLIYWVSAAGWLAQHFVDAWRYDPDPAYLRDDLLPFLQEVGAFYADYLVPDADGSLHMCPSTSPENTPANFVDADVQGAGVAVGGKVRITRDATMDLAVAREVLTHLIELSDAAGQGQDDVPRWRALLEKLPDYEVNEHGAMREWTDPRFLDQDAHRHLSHLYPAFPGTEITSESRPELFAACRTALERRQVVDPRQLTGWSLAHSANIFARFGDGEQALGCLDILSRTSLGANLFGYHNDDRGAGVTLDLVWGRRPPFQIDANMGWTAAVYEMLLFSTPDLLRLAPALPARWRRGAIKGLQTRARVAVDLAWDQDARWIKATFCAKDTRSVAVRLPAGATLTDGPAVADGLPSVYRLDLTAGASVELRATL